MDFLKTAYYHSNQFLLHVLVIAFCVIVAISVMILSPIEFIIYSGHGFQLLGANLILDGFHPFIDFKTPYGPLVFYLSAAAQKITDSRIIGEVVLDSVGFFTSYLLLFVIAYGISKRFVIAYGITLYSLLFFPNFFKYYILLGPVLVLFSLFLYSRKQSCLRILFFACSVVITMLFRFDFGLYGLVAGSVQIFILSGNWVKRQIVVLVSIILFLSPWLLSLILSGHFHDYIYQSTIGSLTFGYGTSLSLPLPNIYSLISYDNAVFIIYLLFYAIPIVTSFRIYRQWQFISVGEKSFITATTTLALLSLIQSIHRFDVSHLLQAVTPQFVLLAWFAREIITRWSLWGKVIIAIATVLTVTLSIYFSSTYFLGLLNRFGQHRTLRQDFMFYFKNKKEYIEDLISLNYQNAELRVIHYLSSDPELKSIAVFPVASQISYWSDLPLSSSYLFISPGYFSSESEQVEMISELERRRNQIIVLQPKHVFDPKKNNTMDTYMPLVYRYIIVNYTADKEVGPYIVYKKILKS